MSDSVVAVVAPVVAAPAPAAVAAAPVAKKTNAPKAPKAAKIPKAKTPSSHPPYISMIQSAIKQLKDRKGASKQAILKYISQNYKLGDNVIQINSHLRQALKRGVVSKAIVQAAGSGANGRFKVPEKTAPATTAVKKSAPAPKIAVSRKITGPQAAVKPKKAAAKPKKAAAVAGAKKTKKAASPKKIAKPVAKKAKKPVTPKKAAAPKKAVAAKPKKAAAKPAAAKA
ncbi:unnamed protein product [Caenorhabditis sp. 36 PRJEB53466]|nr:unnamed protein product [Caenorhabditis sp. 36 PRJEB53466]